MPRRVEEWIGSTPDTPVPDRVKVRVLSFFDSCCQLCGMPILLPKDCAIDHRYALIEGGENRETNLQPVHVWCHAAKTRQEVARKSKTYKIRRHKLLGRKTRSITGWQKFDGTPVRAPRKR